MIARVAVLFLITSFGYGYCEEEAAYAYAREDYSRALNLFLPLAQRGDPRAQTSVGIIFANALGTAVDYSQALRWLTKAADQQVGEAQLELGKMHRDGLGVPVDSDTALKLFESASDKDTPNSYSAVGSLLLSKRQIAAASVWFHRGTEIYEPEAFYYLGWCALKGQGVPQDDIEAHMWLSLAVHASDHEQFPLAANDLLLVRERMTPAQTANANRKFHAWLLAHPRRPNRHD